jgi:hypothetical protein
VFDGDSLGLTVDSGVRWGQVVCGGTWLHIFGDSLGLTVVFKCSMVTGGVWGNMDIYFWGLLGVDGCIQMFGGVRT